jgi:cyclopropane fatty-acyl-phospholipid synthase-like methyltransferase
MDDYWSSRFRSGGMIWGTEHSPTADAAAELFRKEGAERILVPGAGYGRNSKAFSGRFRTEAVELSEEAVRIGREWDSETLFRQGSVLDAAVTPERYDGIYAYDVLHLFLREDRERFAANCVEWLGRGGMLYATCFSDEDSNNGTGRMIEEGTYEYMPGKYAHFFTEADLAAHFPALQVVSAGSVGEILRYGDSSGGGMKRYKLRWLAARKP